jgi:cell pole-organizing protein PopZ
MAQQSSQQEPTMEEILASIRRIISEDAEDAPKESEAAPAAQPQPVQARQLEPEPVEEEVLELDQVVEPEEEMPPFKAPEPEPPPPRPAVQARVEPRRPRTPEPVQAPEEEDLMLVENDSPRGGLVSQNAASAISNAFGQLNSRTRVTDEPGNTLEDIVRGMLKPILQEWLEANLPAITERLVAEEIERVQRTNRRR